MQADVAVLGAGYTGLTAALELAARGRRVVVLEAQRIGWGASGRNGGQALVGYDGLLYLEDVAASDVARAYKRMTLDALGVGAGASVVDVGCGAGRRGLAIKRASGAHVTGVEHSEQAAHVARTRLDEVHTLDLTTARELPW